MKWCDILLMPSVVACSILSRGNNSFVKTMNTHILNYLAIVVVYCRKVNFHPLVICDTSSLNRLVVSLYFSYCCCCCCCCAIALTTIADYVDCLCNAVNYWFKAQRGELREIERAEELERGKETRERLGVHYTCFKCVTWVNAIEKLSIEHTRVNSLRKVWQQLKHVRNPSKS